MYDRLESALKEWGQVHGLSRAAAVRQVVAFGVDAGNLSRYKNGATSPSPGVLVAIQNALGVSLDYLCANRAKMWLESGPVAPKAEVLNGETAKSETVRRTMS
jgi:transcriptional regulator with XRE-family HTH domain